MKGVFAVKKVRELLWILLAAILLPVALGGCGGGGNSAAKVSRVTTDRPAVLLGEMPDLDFMPALVARLTNRTEGEIADETEVVVLHDRTIGSLTDAQRAGLKKVYEREGIVILIEPTYDELTEAAGIVGHELAAAEDRGAEHFCDLYAFNGDWHTYVVGHTHVDDPASGDASLDPAAEAAYYETMMDGLAAWIDRGGPVKKRPSQNRGDGKPKMEDLVKAQTVTHYHTFKRSDVEVSTGYTDTYFIYALYDYNNDYDYYVFEQEVMLVNGPMNKGKWTPRAYMDCWGYWLYSFDAFHLLEGTVDGKYTAIPSALVDIFQPSPTTVVGRKSYSVGMSYTWAGALGFSGLGGTGGLSGGVEYDSSVTMNVSDLAINFKGGVDIGGNPTGTDSAYWQYQVQNLPKMVFEGRWTATAPPPIAVSTAMFYNRWIWRVHNPRKNGGTFAMNSTCNPTYTRSSYAYDRQTDPPIVELSPRYTSPQSKLVNLIPPPREKPKSAAP